MDRPEICVKLLDITIDNVLGAGETRYTNTFEINLEADRLLFVPTWYILHRWCGMRISSSISIFGI